MSLFHQAGEELRIIPLLFRVQGAFEADRGPRFHEPKVPAAIPDDLASTVLIGYRPCQGPAQLALATARPQSLPPESRLTQTLVDSPGILAYTSRY
jgi:hypothetical protein